MKVGKLPLVDREHLTNTSFILFKREDTGKGLCVCRGERRRRRGRSVATGKISIGEFHLVCIMLT